MIYLTILFLLGFAPLSALAGDSEPMHFSVFWPCNGNNHVCAPAILAEGIIERDTDQKLSAFLLDKEHHPHKLPAYPRVCFNSSGGNLLGSLVLGRLIRNSGFDTCLGPEYDRVIPGTFGEQQTFVKNAQCSSACAFAFLGVCPTLAPETGCHESPNRLYVEHSILSRREALHDDPYLSTL